MILALIAGMGYLIFYLTRRRKLGFKKGIKEIEEALVEIRKVEEREREARRLKEQFEERKIRLEEELRKVEERESPPAEKPPEET